MAVPSLELDSLLAGPAFHADPYSAYARLRAEEPLHWHAPTETWFISRYADAGRVLADTQTFRSAGSQSKLIELMRPELYRAVPTFRRRGAVPTLISSDRPKHAHLRRLLQPSFSRGTVQSLYDRIDALTGCLVAQMDGDYVVDVIDSLASPLPAFVLAEVLGLPPEDHQAFVAASATFVRFINRADPNAELTLRDAEEAEESLGRLAQYLEGLIQARGSDPRDDVISRLVHSDSGPHIESDEILWNLVLLLSAGHETTTSLISSGLLLLMEHRSELNRLRADPALMSLAIEEMLRYESPIQRIKRVVGSSVEFCGKQLRAGDYVHILVGAVNRDSAVFSDAERFDVARRPNRHLAFGRNAHFCLGAELARLEATAALSAMLQRFTDIHLANDWQPVWAPTTNPRRLVSLPVRLER